jgi:hypothetical protein
MHRTLALTTLGLVLAGWAAAREAEVGTRPGDTLPGPFRAFVCTGLKPPATPDVVLSEDRQNLGDPGRIRKFHDFVTRFGLDPAVAVFCREAPPSPDQPLGKLFKELDGAVEKYKAARLHAFGVFLTLKGEFFKDETQSAQVKQIEAFAQQAELRNVPLALDQVESDRTKAYQLAPEQTVTVLIYVNLTVKSRLTFTADKPLDDAGVQAVMADVNKLVAPQK